MQLFLYGPDVWTKNQKIKQIIARFIKEVDPSRMNVIVVGVEDADEEDIQAKLAAPPFLAPKRMIILKNLITGLRRKAVQQAVLQALQNIGESTVVVVSEDGTKPKKWANQGAKGLWEYLDKNAEKEEFKLSWGAKLEAVIQKQAKAQGLTLQKDAAALLAMLSGGDLGYTAKEMEKLTAYCGERTADVEDIKKLCTAQGEASIFDFLDALGNKNQKTLVRTMEEQLQETDPLQLIARATGHVRALLALTLKGQSGAQALQLHPFQAKKISAQMRNWDTPALKRFLFQLMTLDYSVKRGLIADPATQLTALLARVV